MLTAISPIDGRYASKTTSLQPFFSEFGLIKYRVFVEVQYFIALAKWPIPELKDLSEHAINDLVRLTNQFSEAHAQEIKDIERTTNHDVKAVEYFLKQQFDQLGLHKYKEFIHFGLTSQDVNNTAIPLSIKHALNQAYTPLINGVCDTLKTMAKSWEEVPMLARTHGQPASPTRMGKEFQVFISRLESQLQTIASIPLRAKFGGATGNFNAHQVAYPNVDWPAFADHFVHQFLGLERSKPTTQIEHYDFLAALFHNLMRINTILIDLCRDIWHYISIDYFGQQVIANEVGSSAMPHKVNPIDFENAEGNLGIANAIFDHLAAKLPISRLQRDLTDSTVLRNIGVPFGHTLIALQSIQKGLGKIILNPAKINVDLEQNWLVVAEAIQNILRRAGYENPYELLKSMTRGNNTVTADTIHQFIDGLDIPDALKRELKLITPFNYLGVLDY